MATSTAPATTRTFLFNQFSMLERCALRNGNVHSADGWRDVLDPVIARYATRDILRFFRADAAYAIPAIYARLEEAGYFYAIRLPANNVLREKIAHLLTRPVGRPSLTKVNRFYEDLEYQAASWDKERRVIAKIEMASGRAVPACRLYRHQPADGAGLGGAVLQPARHRRAAHQGRQIRLSLDAAVMPEVPRQRGATATARAGLQSGNLLALQSSCPRRWQTGR